MGQDRAKLSGAHCHLQPAGGVLATVCSQIPWGFCASAGNIPGPCRSIFLWSTLTPEGLPSATLQPTASVQLGAAPRRPGLRWGRGRVTDGRCGSEASAACKWGSSRLGCWQGGASAAPCPPAGSSPPAAPLGLKRAIGPCDRRWLCGEVDSRHGLGDRTVPSRTQTAPNNGQKPSGPDNPISPSPQYHVGLPPGK